MAKRKGKIGTGHNPVPFTRAHSDKVKVNRKEQRREASKEAKMPLDKPDIASQ